VFCKVNDFKEAVDSCIELLSSDALESRGIDVSDFDENSSHQLESLKGFLIWVKKKIEMGVDSYSCLVEELQKSKVPRDYQLLIGFLGKILDAIQVMKDHSLRNEQVKNAIRRSLERTGHNFLLDEVDESLKRRFFKELLSATATFLLLEVVFSFSNSVNPISSLRRSMGDRLPEEYFSELLAGWLVEEVICNELEQKEISVTRYGVDRERKVLFKRPENMGDYDLIFSLESEQGADNRNVRLEIQRVGKNKIPKDKNEKAYRVDLKLHKSDFLENDNSMLLLWIGEGKFRIENGEKTITPRKGKKPSYLLFISKEDSDKVKYDENAEKLFIDPEFLKENAIEWKRFKEMTREEFVESLGI